jgi:predicted nucleic acid-binding protein
MMAADTSVVIAWLNGLDEPETRHFREMTRRRRVLVPSVVITEIASGPNLDSTTKALIARMPMLQIQPDYWRRAGQLRAQLIQAGRKARLGDALIAQACIDADMPLLTRDRDFEAFAALGGLKLVAV